MSSADNTIISARGVGVRRDNKWLIRDVDFAISRGEIVTLIGPNGAGKTTLAKTAIGVMRADEGSVSIAPQIKIGYAPQRLQIDWTLPLTVARLLTLTARHPKSAVEEALHSVGASHLWAKAVQSLSGGEFQRVLLARAMIGKPDLLVLDEPVQGVDFSGEVELYNLISAIRKQTKCGVLLISHDLHVVMAESDTVICLNGHVCCTGAPQSVINDPEYKRLFGRRAAETLALYQHKHDHTHLPDGRVSSTPENASATAGEKRFTHAG